MIQKILNYLFYNKIYIIKNGKRKREFFINGMFIHFNGKNNTVIINSGGKIKNCQISFNGDNNLLEIGKIKSLKRSKFIYDGNNSKILIKNSKNNIYDSIFRISNKEQEILLEENVSISGISVNIWNSNARFHIGRDSMLSWGIIAMIGDGHQIIDKSNLNSINSGGNCYIGNHVWICHNSYLGKNCSIPDGCIVGANSVVTKSFTEENCVIAGNPAKIVKHNIEWLRDKSI